MWRKSTRSTATNCCVEVATGIDSIGVRDSKDPDGPALRFPLTAWSQFLVGVKAGEFDLRS